MALRFGLVYDFRNPDRWEQPWPELVEAMLKQIALADRLGYDSIWITEHHFAEDGYTPAPIPLMAAIAARTKRVEISTDIVILPLYHAVRLAEDVATVDILSAGRVMLGVGMGYRAVEFAGFGQTRAQRVRRTEEGLDVLRGAWGPGPFSYDGRYYQLDEVNVTPKPVQQPHPPLWLGAMSEPAARRAARFDLHLLPQGDRRAAYEPWLDELGRLGKNPADYRVGLIKPWFLRDDASESLWREVRERERYRAESYGQWTGELGTPGDLPGEPQPIDQRYMTGPPAAIIEQIEAIREDLGLTDIITWGTPPGMDPALFSPHLERFAAEVMPHFREG